MHGFRPQEGLVMAVSLQRHIARVGNDLFWVEFDEFSKWASETFGCHVMPFLTPYPKGIPVSILGRFQQMLTELRARWLGDFQGGLDWSYALWSPFADLLKVSQVKEAPANVAPIILKGKGNKVIECEQSVWEGFEGSFGNGLPGEIEKFFFERLLDVIVKSAPPSLGIVRPDLESLDRGFRGEGGSVINLGHPTLFLFGTSILRDAGPALADLTEKRDMNVISSCAGGSMTKVFEQYPIPIAKHKDDTLILHCLGNPSVSLLKFDKVNDTYHPHKPNLLNDSGVENVVQFLSDTLTWVTKSFKGRVIVVGPMPRYLDSCCENPDHQFPDHTLFTSTMEYYLLLNTFLAKHPDLRSKFEFDFCTYNDIFSEPFDSSFLCDSVHLVKDRSDEYAGFLCNIIDWKPKSSKNLSVSTSFLTWSESVIDQFHRVNKPYDEYSLYLAELTKFVSEDKQD